MIGNRRSIEENCVVHGSAKIVIGDFCIIGAGGVVFPETKIPENVLAIGAPIQVKCQLSRKQREKLIEGTAFYANLARECKRQGL